MDTDELLVLLRRVADAVLDALGGLKDWGLAGTRPGQYRSDLAADEAALAIFAEAGLGVLSEESGTHDPERPLFAVIDPVDGSTNASRRIPWYATSICVLDDDGPLVALVRNQATGTSYEAVRGRGATRDGVPIAPSQATVLRSSVIAFSGFPGRFLGWSQYRALGAAALDLCCVADGTVDAYLDCSRGAHGPWDYLGGLLVCREAGAVVGETSGRELVVRGHDDRRGPVAAATPQLLEEVVTVFTEARAERERERGQPEVSDATVDPTEGAELATPTLQRLLELQREDSHADQLRYQAAHSPARQALRALEAEEAALKAKAVALAPTRAPLEARQSALEAEIAEAAERIAGIDARLRSTESGSYRDQQAMSLEMDSLSRRRRELEDQELEVMEALEPLEEALAATAEAHRALEAERERLNAVIEEETRVLVTELHEVTARREAIAAGLPVALLSEYERLRAHNDGIGAAHLVHGTCSGCNLALSSTELDRVRHAPPDVVSHCEQCGRILVP